MQTIKRLIRQLIPSRLFKTLQPYYHGSLALLSHYWNGRPSEKMIIVSVTGTKGKTTTAHLTYQLLNRLGHKCGLISTAVIDSGTGEQMNWFRMTQMSGSITHGLLHQMRSAGYTHAVIEVSSEGLAQNRHAGINFDIAVFTNLSPDHVEAHGGFENYKRAKARLFETLHKLPITLEKKKIHSSLKKTIIANLDDTNGLYYLNFKAQQHITYAIENTSANIVATQVKTSAVDSQFSILNAQFLLLLPGTFNIYNALAAIAVANGLGYTLDAITPAVSALRGVPGRMEILQTEPFTVIVDYAHEKASLTALYNTVTQWPHQRILQVFGATGGIRDKSRRIDLGTIAGQRADVLYITDEDPFDEDPSNIIHDVASAAVRTGKEIGKNLFLSPNRRESIARALKEAQPGDLVLITGKGAEQKIARANGQYEDWDDRAVVREQLHLN